MSQAIDEIMTDIHDRLEGSGLQFALVLWKPGVPTGMDSIGLSFFPEGSPDAATALALAAVKAERTKAETAPGAAA